MAYYIGIDVSTTATKALLLDDTGNVVHVASNPHRLSNPRPLWSEQDPENWWHATQESLREVVRVAGTAADQIRGIGLTGQMHGLVLLDADGNVLRPAMLWNDGRSSDQCDWLRKTIGHDRLIDITGNDAFEGFTLPKLLWVKEHEPDVFARARQILLPKDYIRYRLTGEYGTDKAGAGGTLMLDLRTREWSREILEACEIPFEWLPRTHEGPETTGVISASASSVTGLAAGTPVVAGGGDQAAGAVGMGAVEPGIVSLTVGTSGVVFAPTDSPLVAPQGRAHAFPHAAPGCWHLMGVMLSAAGSLRWYHDTLTPDVNYDALLTEAGNVDPGADGLTFLPYLTGERTPHANPRATGMFFGLTLRHERAHLTRAVIEGVSFGLRDNLRLLEEAGINTPTELRISGGGVQSPIWRQILADVMNVPMRSVQTPEAGALGAALLAAVGGGRWTDVASACAAAVETGGVTEPNSDAAARYDEAYDRFRRLYPAVESLF
jgi:xylulokinase